MSDNATVKRTKGMEQLLLVEYGLATHPGPESGVVAVQTTVTKLCSNNPTRVGLSFHNLGSNNIFVYFNNDPSANKGILVAGGGGVLAFDWRVDMALIPNDWYAIALTGATNLQVIEVVTL